MKASNSLACYAIMVFLLSSCIISRDERRLKRSTKEWRQSPPVLHAYADSPFAGLFFTLRQNNKFERTSSGMFMGFATGTWTVQGDTIKLIYVDSHQNVIANQNVYIDRKTSTLIFQGEETPTQMRLRVMFSRL